MTAMPKFKAEVTTTDVARVGGHVARVFAAIPCPCCLRGRLHASAWRETGENEFEWTCPRCHSDIITITF